MSAYADAIRTRLAGGPASARQLAESLGLSQPTISRALAELCDEIVRIGSARSEYTLRDTTRGLPEIPVYRIDAEGRIQQLGALTPVRPDGFVMRQADGATLHSDGLPWWLFDMRPQGYLGRAYAARHGAELGLPDRLTDWTDTHVFRALLAHGHIWWGICCWAIARAITCSRRPSRSRSRRSKKPGNMPGWRWRQPAAKCRDRQPGVSSPSSPPGP